MANGAHDTLGDNASVQITEDKPWEEDGENANHDGNSGHNTPGDDGDNDHDGTSKPPSPDGSPRRGSAGDGSVNDDARENSPDDTNADGDGEDDGGMTEDGTDAGEGPHKPFYPEDTIDG